MLTDLDHEYLAFEERHEPTHRGWKQQLIRERFGCSPARYYQRIITLMHDPDTVPAYPQLVKRWHERQQKRRAS